MNTRLENLILSGLVAAAISVSVSSAGVLPVTGGSPSLADKYAALVKRVDQLQQREAIDRANIKRVADAAATAQAASACIIGGRPFNVLSVADSSPEGQTDYYVPADENVDGTEWFATIDRGCLA